MFKLTCLVNFKGIYSKYLFLLSFSYYKNNVIWLRSTNLQQNIKTTQDLLYLRDKRKKVVNKYNVQNILRIKLKTYENHYISRKNNVEKLYNFFMEI